MSNRPLRIMVWGTYDTGKPRTRILLRSLKVKGAQVTECHSNVWENVADKSELRGFGSRLRLALRWLSSYPRLVMKLVHAPRPDVILVCYLGQLDVIVLWPFARALGIPVVWDAFISLYDTVVVDRQLVQPESLVARALFSWEWIASRAANLILLDTKAHADYFTSQYGLTTERARHVLVGAEPEAFFPQSSSSAQQSGGEISVLFYGQLIPLHGVETIIEAARLAENDPIRWTFIGIGQQAPVVIRLLSERPLKRFTWIPWAPYEELVTYIHAADVCLGIFGDSDKASRVIPNKVYQILACNARLVTRESPAIRELLICNSPNVSLVPACDPQALLDAIRTLGRQPKMPMSRHQSFSHQQFSANSIADQLIECLEFATGWRQ